MIAEEDHASDRKAGREERPIPGCTKAHIISFFPDGNSVMKWSNIRDFMKDVDKIHVNDEIIDDNEDDEPEEVTWNENVDDQDKFDLIDIHSYIAVKSTNNEQFNLYRVEEKKVASERIEDTSGEHYILCDEPYLVCRWYSFQNDGRKFAQYACAKSTKLACIHVGEVFMTDIVVDDKCRLDIGMCRMLASSF